MVAPSAPATAVSSEEAPISTGSFRGWRMVAIAFVGNFISGGITLSTFGNFVDPVSATFGVARSTTTHGATIAVVMIGCLGPFAGVMLDRGWARPMMAIGSLVAGVGLLLLSRATELWQAGVLFCGVVALGASLFGVMPMMALTSKWFERRRGLAIGIGVAGSTIAAWAAPATAEALIELYGWRTAIMAFGFVTLLIGFPIFAGLIVDRPETIGQLPDGDTKAISKSEGGSEVEGIGMAELARDSRLWLLAFGFGLVLTSPVVLSPMIVPYGKDLGFSGQEATLFFLAMVPFSLLGKIVIGIWADRAPLKPAIFLVVLGNVAAWYLLYLEPSFMLFVLTGAIYGIGVGGVMPLQGVVIGRCFGRANFGRVSGLGGLVMILLIAGAMALFQSLYATTGNYRLSFMVQIAAIVVGGLLISLVRIPKPTTGQQR